jgi:hypothetical protein
MLRSRDNPPRSPPANPSPSLHSAPPLPLCYAFSSVSLYISCTYTYNVSIYVCMHACMYTWICPLQRPSDWMALGMPVPVLLPSSPPHERDLGSTSLPTGLSASDLSTFTPPLSPLMRHAAARRPPRGQATSSRKEPRQGGVSLLPCTAADADYSRYPRRQGKGACQAYDGGWNHDQSNARGDGC